MGIIQKALKQAKSTHVPLMNKLSIQFAKNIEHLRKQRGLKKKELAQKVGVSQAYITKVMQGEANYTLETMAKFAHALEADINLHMCDKTAMDRVDQQLFFGQIKQAHAKASRSAFNDEEFVIAPTQKQILQGENNVAISA
jgi:transcriptional regulator with XRE-family HTH domain